MRTRDRPAVINEADKIGKVRLSSQPRSMLSATAAHTPAKPAFRNRTPSDSNVNGNENTNKLAAADVRRQARSPSSVFPRDTLVRPYNDPINAAAGSPTDNYMEHGESREVCREKREHSAASEEKVERAGEHRVVDLLSSQQPVEARQVHLIDSFASLPQPVDAVERQRAAEEDRRARLHREEARRRVDHRARERVLRLALQMQVLAPGDARHVHAPALTTDRELERHDRRDAARPGPEHGRPCDPDLQLLKELQLTFLSSHWLSTHEQLCNGKNAGNVWGRMLWPRDEFHAAYGQIKHDALQSGGASVLVLVALDVDALCASAILTRLFKADFVSYALLPVRGYEDIVRIRDARIASAAGRELRSIVMINCGAIVNVTQLLALPPNVKCYIFDSHRPIHLANIYDAGQQIVVFDDGAQAIEEFPEDGSDIDRDEFEDSEEEDEDDEEAESDEEEDAEAEEVDEDDGEAEVEFGDTTEPTEDTEPAVGNGAPASPGGSADGDIEQKKRKRSEDGETGGDDEDGEEGEDNKPKDEGDSDVEMVSPKKQRTGIRVEEAQEAPEEELNAKQAKRKRREQILRYYRGSFHGAPAASIAFELAQQMNAGSNRDLLWFAIVGLTKQFVMEEIDADNYNLMIHRFQDEVLALDATAASGGNDDDQAVANPAYEHGRITFEEEYRFMCYRHWSLYEAMYYSDYVAAKLGLYMDQARRFGARNAASTNGNDGETTLHVFLARMGFSLRQSQQKFTYMPLEMKQQLRDKIQEIAPEFGLDDVFYGSFKRQFAFQYLLGAADAVHGLHALLEAPESYISSVFQAENHNQKGLLQQPVNSAFTIDSKGITAVVAKEGEEPVEDQSDDLRDFKHQNFFMATSALSCSSVASTSLMESGIKVAMELKQAIVRVGISIMERKLIVRVKHFRYVCLNIPEREQELFANPNVLTQLALFLLTVHRASGKWGGVAIASKKKKKGDEEEDGGEDEPEEAAQQKPIVPLVLITKNPAQNCFLIVGITCPNNPGEVHRNTLGTAFRLAAGETGANFRQDGFSSAVLEIQMDDIQYFVEQLHNVMDA